MLEMKVQELQVELEFVGGEPGGCNATEKFRLENKDLQNQLQAAMDFMRLATSNYKCGSSLTRYVRQKRAWRFY